MGTFEEFEKIIRKLRAEDGCPWDRKQTFESLKPCVIDESAEVIAAVSVLSETGQADNLCEELGDLLMLIVMMAHIAEEQKLFTMEDVISGIGEKMIRRHPHVFGSGHADNAEQVLVNWDAIKKAEKAGKDPELLEKVKRALTPAAVEMITHLQERISDNP